MQEKGKSKGKRLKIIFRDFDFKDLKSAEYNPRYLSKKAEADLTKSIEKFTLVEPIVVNINKDRKNVVVGGHQRIKICKKLGYTGSPCVVVDLPLKEEKELNVRLNGNKGEFDDEKLREYFGVDELIEYGFEEVYFESSEVDFGESVEFEEEEKAPKDRDELNEVDEVVKVEVKEGQIWKMGRHAIICGDCTDPKIVRKLLNESKGVLVFTDPPYGMKKEKDGVNNDNLNFNDLLEFNKKWIDLSFNVLNDVGSWYCWGIDEPLMDIYSEILKPKIKAKEIAFRNLITWNKGASQGQMQKSQRRYATADEKCLFVVKGTSGFVKDKSTWYEGFEEFRAYYDKEAKKMKWTRKKIADLTNTYSDHYFNRSQYSFPTQEHHEILQKEAKGEAFTVPYEEFKARYDEVKQEQLAGRTYFNNTHDNFNSVWHFGRTTPKEREGTGNHATPKPIELCERGILSSSREDDIVIDFFTGSGSTLIGCELNNRIFRGIEIDPYWVQVTINRWENMTGKKAILVKE